MNVLNKILGRKKEVNNPMKQKLSDSYLYQTHSRSTIRSWANDLKFGFYKRAWGGHANDGDEFGIWLNYNSKEELFQILEGLNITLKKIPENYPKAIPGKSYPAEEFEKFKNEIKDFPEYEQPSHISISSVRCFCWIENGKLSISLAGAEDGNRYEVTEADFNNCLVIERTIEKANLQPFKSKEYEDWVTHVSPKYYPELFE
jgi:hypothetical protein